jgi:plasmid stabilization system protein ParE
VANEIIWSPLAVETYESIIDYLLLNFGEKAAIKFVQLVDDLIWLIASNPKMFRKSSKKADVYLASIQKKVTLFYRFKASKKQVELIVFWGKQNPANLPL